MMHGLTHILLLTGWLPTSLYGITLALALVVVALKPRGRRLPALLKECAVGLVAFIVVGILVWFMSDRWMVFGVELGWLVMAIVAAAAGALGFSITAIVHGRRWRRVAASVLVPFVLISSAVGVNAVYGEYTTLGSVLNLPNYRQLDQRHSTSATMTVAQWRRLAVEGRLPAMPKVGEVRTVKIPATVSHFVARDADVYLPPAALSHRPPALPVMVMMAGQPGSPDRFFGASNITTMMNDYAQHHHGLAPIVISPDQNGSTKQNSLCADTPVYGKAETYLTVDVTRWVTKNLPVSEAARNWLIGGFSQGATCSTQLGPAHPNLYGHIFAANGELEPTSHNRSTTVNRYFGGDLEAYLRHVPTEIIAREAPSAQTMLTTAGAWDAESQRNQLIIGKAAREAGMAVTTLISRDSGHDWHAVQAALHPQIEIFGEQTGLGTNTKRLSQYGGLDIIEQTPSTTDEVK
ncbi:alpha/beta hydrolase [Bifidobacterium mongoliense]|jgi:S-formylglutathione hydrolase FrmB|nr:alpha/beta hydrolase-fold protein [Bifidobacterium mongoliense]